MPFHKRKASRTAQPSEDLPMKRRKRQDRRNRPRRDNRKSRFDPDYTGDDERHNADFEAYYRAQRIVPEEEFSTMLKTLATPLPTSFRVIANGPFREAVQTALHGEMSDLVARVAAKQPADAEEKGVENETKTPEESVPVTPLGQLSWYPDGLAWSVSAPRQMLRRDNVLAPFHKFIVHMNTLGAINRQEAVSMVPPLMLDVQKGHAVLDMCAAPGSKTAQIVEALSTGKQNDLQHGGIIVANDSDLKRCWLLAHQLKRFGSPELIITQHEAQDFPMFMAFDRVLCDVPCSGDGTLRKAPDIWRRWNSDMGVALHRTQRMIAERGIELLKPGGRLVYSTCSINPLENEAVVAHLLRKFGDGIELLDCSKELPTLKRRKGLTSWRVKNNSGTAEKGKEDEANNGHDAPNGSSDVGKKEDAPAPESTADVEAEAVEAEAVKVEDVKAEDVKAEDVKAEDVKAEDVIAEDATADGAKADGAKADGAKVGDAKEEGMECATETKEIPDKARFSNGEWFNSYDEVRLRRRRKILESMFPPSAEELAGGKFPLERSMRFVPHDQNTGAFFVAVFKKKETQALTKRLTKKMESLNKALADSNNHVTEKTTAAATSNGSHAPAEATKASEVTEEQKEVEGEAEIKGDEAKGAGEKAGGEEKGEKSYSTKASRLIAEDALVGVGTISPETLRGVSEFFGIDSEVCEHYMMTRGADHENFKKIVVVSRTVRTVLRHAIGTRDKDVERQRRVVRVVNAGVRVLERTDRKQSGCGFRLIHDGVGLVRGVMSKRVMESEVEVDEVVELLKTKQVTVAKRTEARAAAFWTRVLGMGSGSGVIVCRGEAVLVWVGQYNVSALMTNEIIAATLMRLGHGDVTAMQDER